VATRLSAEAGETSEDPEEVESVRVYVRWQRHFSKAALEDEPHFCSGFIFSLSLFKCKFIEQKKMLFL